MTFSRWIRLSAAVCAAMWWMAMASPIAQVSSLQSPLEVPGQFSPVEPPSPDPFTGSANEICNDLIPCTDGATPQTDFSTFVPSLGTDESANEFQEPATPPDLGTVLNYIAIAIIVVGVPLRLYWYMQDRRKKDRP